jgi:uncharacterized repeat protein (TIGR01451 family)
VPGIVRASLRGAYPVSFALAVRPSMKAAGKVSSNHLVLSGRKKMKSFLIGATVLSGVVGLGAAAAFFGHDLIPQSADSQVETTPVPIETSRDLTPQPIPLADATLRSATEEPAGSSNPFATGLDQVQPAAAVEDPYPDPTANEMHAQPAVAHVPVENDEALQQAAESYGADPLDDDIPLASELDQQDPSMARSGDPFAAGQQPHATPESAYPERSAAAEETTDAPNDAADTRFNERASGASPDVASPDFAAPAEPGNLQPVPVRESVDRYGRPLPGAQPAPAEATPAGLPPTDNRATNDTLPRDDIPPADVALQPGEDFTAGTVGAAGVQPLAGEALEDGNGRPGDPRLSGAQAPTLTIEKTAPPEIQIGKPAKFLIKVRNAGSVDAHGVEVRDMVPRGTQLLSATPPATRGPNDELIWDLGTLKPGKEHTIEVELMPTAEGEIGSVATVHFRAEASVRTMATKPMLEMEVTGPEQVMKGQPVNLNIKIFNPGSGATTGIVLSDSVPQGLSHPAGNILEFDVGTLKPGESRELQLALVAAEAGTVTNIISARGEGNLQTEVQTVFEVIAPQLTVSMTGPKRRYLERNATHNISVQNPGTAAAKDIELVAVLPQELQFVSADNNGQFDQATHSVYWSLEELPPQETGTVTLTTLPMKSGDAKLLIKSKAQQNLTDEREEVVVIDGLAAITFQLSDANDPIEVNGQTTYEVRVTNQGTKAASNLQLVALLPTEMKGISADGPARHRIEGQRVVFEPLRQLAPKGETIYKITAQALQPGDLRLQVQLSSDEISDPISKEESTRVYGNE